MKVVAILGLEDRLVEVLHEADNELEYYPEDQFIAEFGMKLINEHLNRKQAWELMYHKELLTQAERDICMLVMPEMAKEMLFHQDWNNTWLNLNVYSERDKEEHDLRMERGY
jgi:hypothetical protein